MAELLLTLGILAVLGGGAMLLGWLSWETQLVLGLVLLAAGALGSLPSGVVYHLFLLRRLGPRDALPPRWWLSPTALHDRLAPADRRALTPILVVGVTSFVLVLIGGFFSLVAAWRAR